jgi:hypothetical protein
MSTEESGIQEVSCDTRLPVGVPQYREREAVAATVLLAVIWMATLAAIALTLRIADHVHRLF